MNILNAWSSFSATDINHDNSLDISELKVLIWLIENEEPDEIRVRKYMKQIDADGNNIIDRIEWIKYIIN